VECALIYHPIYLKHDLPTHPENALRLKYFLEGAEPFNLPVEEPKQVSYELLRQVHSENYIHETLISCRENAPGFFDPDTYYNAYTCDAALMAAGANELGVELLLQGKYRAVFCAVRPPGHHAERDRAMGFCVFNNAAVAAVKALSLGLERVFIVDFDAHHGNGTQHAFYDEPRVFYFSTHQYPFYPGTGSPEENNSHVLNVPMREGSGDAEYRKAYWETYLEAVKAFSPELIVVSAGYDLHADDPLTGLEVSDEGVREVVRAVLEGSKAAGCPVLFTLEGGYNLAALKRCSSITFEEILKA